MTYRRLDQILCDRGHVSEEQVARALHQQALRGGRLGEHLLRNGDVKEAELVEALSEQTHVHGVTISNRTIDQQLFNHLPLNVAEQNLCIPIAHDASDNSLTVAFADPLDDASVGAVEQAVQPLVLKPLIGLATHIHAALVEARARQFASPSSAPADTSAGDSQVRAHVTACLDLLELAVVQLRNRRAAATGGIDLTRLVRETAHRAGLDRIDIDRLRLASAAIEIAKGGAPAAEDNHDFLITAAALLRGVGLPDVAGTLELDLDTTDSGKTLSPAGQILRICRDLVAHTGDSPLAAFDADAWKDEFLSRDTAAIESRVVESVLDVVRVRYMREQLFTHSAELLLIGDGKLAGSVQRAARDHGLRVVRSANLNEAISSANRRRPDLVCLLNPIGADRISQRLAPLGVTMASVLVVMPQLNTVEIDSRVSNVLHVNPDLPETDQILKLLLHMLSEKHQGGTLSSSGAPTGRSDAVISGRLEDLGIADLIQVLSSAHKTVRVDLLADNKTASLWFHSGRIIRAESDSGVAEMAFYKLIEWTTGRFEVHPLLDLPGTNIMTPTTALLLEALRRMDEQNRALV